MTPAILSPASRAPAAALAEGWAQARRYVEAATLFQRASLAAQIVAGFVLIDLSKVYNQQGKRSDLGTSSQNGKKLRDWTTALREELTLSSSTAYRWMEMARAARPRLAKGDIALAAILEKNPGALTGPEQELLKTAVHKISDGKTQMEFMFECGLTTATGAQRAGEAGAAATKGKKRPDTAHFLNARAGLVQTRSLAFWDEARPDGTPQFSPAQRAEVRRRLAEALADWPVELLKAAVTEAKLLISQKNDTLEQ